MIFNLVNKYKYLLPVIYVVFGFALCGVLIAFFCAQIHCEECSPAPINPSFYLMPLLAYASIGLVGITIGFTRKTASEKNALDFDKSMNELNESFKVIGEIRKTLLSPDLKVNRRKAYDFMQNLEEAQKAEKEKAKPEASVPPASSDTAASSGAAFMMFSSTTNDKGSHSFFFCAGEPTKANGQAGTNGPAECAGATGGGATGTDGSASPAGTTAATQPASPVNAVPTATEVWKAAGKILNAFEGCANAIRYGIYDEDFIYNVYGSQFINFYELTYGLVKARQREFPRAWVNFEWLAVKWTLRRKITGVTSKEGEETSYIIQESLAAIKEHTKVRPNPEKLKKFMDKLERRKFPA
jgi:hypothetical protein